MFSKDEKDRRKEGEVLGYIGRGMTMEGRLTFDDTVRIDGAFKGEVDATGTLVVGEGGVVEGEVKAGVVIVTGEVRGIITASSRVELKPPGKMFGDIRTPNLIIGEGVVFDGNCVMTKKGPGGTEPAPSFAETGQAEPT